MIGFNRNYSIFCNLDVLACNFFRGMRLIISLNQFVQHYLKHSKHANFECALFLLLICYYCMCSAVFLAPDVHFTSFPQFSNGLLFSHCPSLINSYYFGFMQLVIIGNIIKICFKHHFK